MYNFPFIEAIYEENNDNFQIGDLVTFYNVNSTDVYNNSIYGLVICNKTVDIISLCGALPEPEIIHKLSGSWLIVISEYSFQILHIRNPIKFAWTIVKAFLLKIY